MKNPIVSLVENELIWFEQVLREDRERAVDQRIFPEKDNLYPIPFFGDIRRAEVLTIALNPSHTEFSSNRCWDTKLEAPALTSRYLHYFDLPMPEPHPWFVQLNTALTFVGRSYRDGAAHLDLIPFPTLRPREMSSKQRVHFAETVKTQAGRLKQVLAHALSIKVVMVVDFPINSGDGNSSSVWQQLIRTVPTLATLAAADGQVAPVLRAFSPDALRELVYINRFEVRERFRTGSVLHWNAGE